MNRRIFLRDEDVDNFFKTSVCIPFGTLINIYPLTRPPLSASSTMSLKHSAGQIEILESRIAPAVILVGSPAKDDSVYNAPPFFDTTTAGDPISAVVGPGGFYLKLGTGDSVLIDTNAGYVPFITGPGGVDSHGNPIGITGNVVAFFVDKNMDNKVDPNELTGLALGAKVSVQVSDSVDGDIVSNLNDATFALGGAGEPAGTATDLLMNPITSLTVKGNITRSVVSGGDISNLNITGSTAQVLTGKAADGYMYDFNSTVADGGDTLSVVPAPGVKGGNMNNVTLGAVTSVLAGGGGAGAVGGSISNLTMVAGTDGFTIQAGPGGDGVAGKIGGGPGGALSHIIVNGLDENFNDPTANSAIVIKSGKGGDGFAGGGGKGGMGGAASNIYVGFEDTDHGIVASKSALQDAVDVESGVGGSGKLGNMGGKMTNIHIVSDPTGAGNDLKVLAGAGGANTVAATGGKAGPGGSITTVDVQNPPQDPNTVAAAHMSQIIITGGPGGATMAGFGAGAPGGSVKTAHTIGFIVDVAAGNGSTGVAGGQGGDLSSVVIDEGFFGNTASPAGVRTESLTLDAGHGGAGTAMKGGGGGSINGATLNDGILTALNINQTFDAAAGLTAGDAGASAKGAGTNGGSVSSLVMTAVGMNTGNPATSGVTMNIRSGNGGGGGGANSGNGGGFSGDNTISATDASLVVTSGAGGSATTKGSGGKGGDVLNLGFFGTGNVGGNPATISVTAGNGGTGVDTGNGGQGGALRNLSLDNDGSVSGTAGMGGVGGAKGAAGAGGDIATVGALSNTSSVSLIAGAAQAGGAKPGAGGAITNASVAATTSITITSGAGQNGGVGGKIDGLSFTDANGDITPAVAGTAVPAPVGPVMITSGAGSGLMKNAGAGGDISDVSGVIASGGMTLFKAGAGGAGDSKAASGGSISDINLFGGGGAGAELDFDAGDAALAANAKKGGPGGNVSDVQIGDPFDPSVLDPATIIRHIAAGNGGDVTIAKGMGGTGGSVTDIRVAHDIGVRSGSAFGYTTMGGIFAGEAGLSGAGGKPAVAGSVIGISADAIASIVAGKPVNGDAITARNLAQVVDAIVLNGNVASVTNANGDYTNFGTANIVGGIVDPTGAGNPSSPYPAAHPHANTFDLIVQGSAVDEYGDTDGNGTFSFGDTTNSHTDGFVAAVTFNNDSTTPNNVRVEALLTVDAAGASVFTDLNNTNGQVHT